MNMQENTAEGIPSLDSGKQLLAPETLETSESLPKSVSLQLLDLMKQVVKDGVNPATVNAACKCASEIHKMLDLNVKIKKAGF